MNKTEPMLNLTLAAAQLAAGRAIERAQELGRNMCVAVVDTSGHPLVTLRMPGAPLPSQEYARKKAYTALAFGIPTHSWKQRLEPKPVTMTGLAQHPDVALFGGGEPITIEGQRVGAIGVSGGSEEEDGLCARAALEALEQA
ncbi:GlcG/HbpS family heme-binding protein [Marinobacterium sp. YM272]|uniref:GlcG/HbpS family heme-binding protein n=1 Tax=Marinobacterium sp. YM272 TaxID=3421654 RepID=UPI003D7F86E5